MATHAVTWNERLRSLRKILRLNQTGMAERLGITRVWLSMLENSSREVSELLQIKIERLECERQGGCVNRVNGQLPHASGNGEGPALRTIDGRGVAMPTRADCEAHFKAYLDAAEADGRPENFPYIFRQLRQGLPLDEWKTAASFRRAARLERVPAKRRRG